MPTQKYSIASVASEVASFSRTGGLADVAIALPKALAQRGHQVTIITPWHQCVSQHAPEMNAATLPLKTTVTVGRRKFPLRYRSLSLQPSLQIVFVDQPALFGQRGQLYGYPDDNLRFLVFNVAALRYLELRKVRPHLIHCHDWQSGLIPCLLKKQRKKFPSLKRTATVFTIHNLVFQMAGDWWSVPPGRHDDGRGDPATKPLRQLKYLNFAKRAILNADVINTVSERYAEEITTPEFGQGLDKYLRQRKHDLFGIINGIDYAVYNPAVDPNIKHHYDWNHLQGKKKNKLELQRQVGLEPDAGIPLIGVVNRLTEQKGFNLIMETMDTLMRLRLQMVIVGSGYREYVAFFKRVAKQYPKKLAIYTPFTETLASRVYAASDMFLMPSRFEPCGLSQLISLRYGAIPIVHETGGLSDTITNFNPQTNTGNGFVFRNYGAPYFLIALARALETYKYTDAWTKLGWRAMQQTYSWQLPAKKYLQLYGVAIKRKRQHH